MSLNNLRPAKGSIKKRKRIGRGTGSGRGGTSTRGHKGDKSRSGFKNKRHHEGGQMPLQMRLPKRGFNNFNHTIRYTGFNVGRLEEIATKLGITEITPEVLYANDYISRDERVKILGHGELHKALNVKAHAYSAKGKEWIEKAGGKAELL